MSKKTARQGLGQLGERLAAQHLEACGYRLVEKNFRCAAGEMDIVAWDGECLAFVEVRTRRGPEFGTPEESVTPRKQERLVRVAEAYLAERGLGDVAWRVDVVAVELDRTGRLQRVEVIQDAILQ